MNKILYMLLGVIFITSSLFPQEQDSLIQLYPGMEDTVSFIDRTYFGLYNQIEGFEYSLVFVRDNKELVSRVTFSKNKILKDTILINDLSALENTRLKIDQIVNEHEEKIESLREVKVTTSNSKAYEGTLEGFSKNYLYLLSDKNLITNQESEFKYRLPLSNINQVLAKGESNYLNPVLWGAGIGFVTGVFAPIGLSVMFQETFDEDSDPSVEFSGELLVSGFICTLIGAGIGYVIGLLTAEADIPFEFKSDRSVLRLKDYAMYNFRNLKTFDENYYEVK